jgi:hypothetical protein
MPSSPNPDIHITLDNMTSPARPLAATRASTDQQEELTYRDLAGRPDHRHSISRQPSNASSFKTAPETETDTTPHVL